MTNIGSWGTPLLLALLSACVVPASDYVAEQAAAAQSLAAVKGGSEVWIIPENGSVISAGQALRVGFRAANYGAARAALASARSTISVTDVDGKAVPFELRLPSPKTYQDEEIVDAIAEIDLKRTGSGWLMVSVGSDASPVAAVRGNRSTSVGGTLVMTRFRFDALANLLGVRRCGKRIELTYSQPESQPSISALVASGATTCTARAPRDGIVEKSSVHSFECSDVPTAVAVSGRNVSLSGGIQVGECLDFSVLE